MRCVIYERDLPKVSSRALGFWRLPYLEAEIVGGSGFEMRFKRDF